MTFQLPPEGAGWSSYHYGVAASRNGVIYALTDGGPNEPENQGGVFKRNISHGPEATGWDFLGNEALGGEAQEIPPKNTTWLQIGEFDTRWWQDTGVFTLSVAPGETEDQDQVFVGTRRSTKMYGGYYRFGPTDAGIMWTQMMGVRSHGDGVSHWNNFYFITYNWEDGQEDIDFDGGWRTNDNPVAFVPLAICQTFENSVPVLKCFGAFGAMTVASSDSGKTWAQKFCSAESGGWSSNGISILNCTSADYDSEGNIVIGGYDLGAFKSVDVDNAAFEWLNWYYDNDHPDVFDVEINRGAGDSGEDEIFVLRTIRSPESFSHGGNTISVDKELRTIAQFVLDHSYHENEWVYLSENIIQKCALQGLNMPRIMDFEVLESGDLLAVIMAYEGSNRVSLLFQAQKTGGLYSSWEQIEGPAVLSLRNRSLTKIENIPGTFRVVVSGMWGAGDYGGCWCVDLDDPTYVQTWLNGQYFDDPQPLLEMAGTYVTAIESSRHGECVYIGTKGNYNGNNTLGQRGAGTIIRVDGPFDNTDASVMPVITALANTPDDDNTFGYSMPILKFPNFEGGNPGWIYTHVHDLAVDPNNPMTVYAGLGVYSFHLSNGVWKYSLDAEGGETWEHVYGGSAPGGHGMSEPAVSVTINPDDPGFLDVGSTGQGFFRASISVSPPPFVSEKALFAVSPSGGSQALLAVNSSSMAGAEMACVVLDGTILGLGETIQLYDDATNGDRTADDDVWSSELGTISVSPGLYELPVLARDELWNTFTGSLSVLVADSPGTFGDKSTNTGDLLTVNTAQSAAIPCDYDGDAKQDILIANADEYGLAMKAESTDDGAPVCDNTTDFVFLDDHLATGILSMVSADFDNDGDEDVFACPASSSAIVYRNQNSTYLDATASVFADPAAVPDHAFGASWGDYDCDGWVDLAVLGRIDANAPAGYPDPDGAVNLLLYRNIQGVLHFTPAISMVLAGESLVDQEPPLLVMWTDLNDDSKPDLFFTDVEGADAGAKIFINAGYSSSGPGYAFSDETENWFGPSAVPNNVIAAQFVDWDNDEDQDFVAGRGGAQDNLLFFRNAGSCFIEEDISSWLLADFDSEIGELVAADFDLNGELDLVVVPEDNKEPPRLLLNDLTGQAGFVEFGSSGLAKGYFGNGFGNTWGSGKPALYLGKNAGVTQNSGKVYAFDNTASALKYHRIAIGDHGPTNSSGLGTKVTVEYTKDGETELTRISKWVTSSSGGGGQSSKVLEFGIDGFSGTNVNVQMTWPDGLFNSANSYISSLIGPDFIFVIDRPGTGFGFVPQRINRQYFNATGVFLAAPDNFNKWRFTFDATQQVKPEVMLFADYEPLVCQCMTGGFSSFLYESGYPGVELEIYPIANGVYRHVMTVPALCCEADCNFEFEITGYLGDQVISSGRLNCQTGTFCLGEF
jgi:hypothetical protein